MSRTAYPAWVFILEERRCMCVCVGGGSSGWGCRPPTSRILQPGMTSRSASAKPQAPRCSAHTHTQCSRQTANTAQCVVWRREISMKFRLINSTDLQTLGLECSQDSGICVLSDNIPWSVFQPSDMAVFPLDLCMSSFAASTETWQSGQLLLKH